MPRAPQAAPALPPQPEPDPELLAQVQAGIQAWVVIQGVDPDDNQGSMSLRKWDIHRTYAEIGQAQLLDPQGLAPLVLLRALLKEYEREVRFRTQDLLDDWEHCNAELEQVRVCRRAVYSDVAVAAMQAFRAWALRLGDHYEIRDEKYEQLLDDPEQLGPVYASALRATQELREDRFTIGKPGTKPLQVSKTIFEVWNLNTLLRIAGHLPEGVSLTLARNPDPERLDQSFFCFVGHDGENLVTWTDRPELVHPQQRDMSRCPGRQYSERVSQNFLPYELLEIELTTNKKHFTSRPRHELVPIDKQIHKLAPLAQIQSPESRFWCAVVLERLSHQLRRQEFRVQELSYTGEMAHVPQLTGTMLPMLPTGYQVLAINIPTNEEIEREAQFERERTGVLDWMVERYGPKVPAEALDHRGIGKHPQLLLDDKGRRRSAYRDEDRVPARREFLAPETFGTKDELIANARWASRYNQVQEINKLAEEEFQQESPGVIDWWHERLRKRKNSLLYAMAKGEFLVSSPEIQPDGPEHEFMGRSPFVIWSPEERAKFPRIKRGILGVCLLKNRGWSDDYGRYDDPSKLWLSEIRKERRGRFDYLCADAGCKATFRGDWCPQTAYDLAALAGVKITDLPFFLQHWLHKLPYSGNQILSRVDPLEWKAQNPWMTLEFRVHAALSRKALNHRRKLLKLPRWEDKQPAK